VSIRTWSYFGSLLIAELLLVLRTVAIWDRSKKIGCSLLAFMIICFSGIGYISERFIGSLGFGIRTSPNTATLSGCIFTTGSRCLWIYFLVLTIFETAIFILTTYKATVQQRWKHCPLFKEVYHHGIVIYACVCLVSIINIVVVNTAPANASNAFHGFHRVLHAILIERLVFRIKRAMIDPTLEK